MEEMNNTMDQMGGGEKKGSGALVGSVIIILIIIIGGIYMFRNAKVQNVEQNMTTDTVVEDLGTQTEGDDLTDIEADLNATDLDNVIPSTEAGVEAQ